MMAVPSSMAMIIHDFEYTPREVSRPTGNGCRGVCQRLWRALSTDCSRGLDRLRRWWLVTTDPGHLSSQASRRDCWCVLLPLPAMLMMIADQGSSNLVVLDASACLILWIASCLPSKDLWPDFVVGGVHTTYVTTHAFVATVAEAQAGGSGCHLLMLLSMACAGVHAVALAVFVAVTFAARLLLSQRNSHDDLMVSLYILAMFLLIEHRVAEATSTKGAGYKALVGAGRHEDVYYDASSTSPVPLRESSPLGTVPYRGPACGAHVQSLPTGAMSDCEESGSAAPLPPPSAASTVSAEYLQSATRSIGNLPNSSGSALADYVLSKMPGPGAAAMAAPQAPPAAPAEPHQQSFAASAQGPAAQAVRYFEAAKVCKPHASNHEAPAFQDPASPQAHAERKPLGTADPVAALLSPRQRSRSPLSAGGRLPPVQEQLGAAGPGANSPNSSPGQCSAGGGSPCGGGSGQQSTDLRGVKLHGFRNAGLNELYIENSSEEFKVNGRETYWSVSGDFFIYSSKSTSTWGVGKAKRFAQIRDGVSNGVAHSPAGFEVAETVASMLLHSKKAWREWDTEESTWANRPGAGIESRGKVRRREGANDKAVQATPPPVQVMAQGVQTEP